MKKPKPKLKKCKGCKHPIKNHTKGDYWIVLVAGLVVAFALIMEMEFK